MSQRFSRIAASAIKLLANLQRPERAQRNRMMVRDLLTERLEIDTPRGHFCLICKERNEVHYAHDFFHREPETIRWIDGMTEPCTIWDIGANIGLYALYAALKPGVTVLAFEPISSSYAALCANTYANSLDGRISNFCLSFFNRTAIENVRLSSLAAGSALHTFGQDGAANGGFSQKSISLTIDGFRDLFCLPPPNYIKIDVDGPEEEILQGAQQTLSDPRVRSVLIEVGSGDPVRRQRMIERLATTGFTPDLAASAGENMIFKRL